MLNVEKSEVKTPGDPIISHLHTFMVLPAEAQPGLHSDYQRKIS